MKIKKIVYGCLFLFLILISVFSLKWYFFLKLPATEAPIVTLPYFDAFNIAKTLSQAIQYKTISTMESNETYSTQFQDLIQYLEYRFINTHDVLQSHRISKYTVLYQWEGSNPVLNPAMFSAHFDVVTTEDEAWKYPPFSGRIDDKFIWGRGALDDKSAIVAMLHAISSLIENQYQPKRTLYFAFGGDEEIGGNLGAKKISDFLSSKNITLEFLLDEGMPITDGIMTGVEKPVAMIGIAEKGLLNLKLVTVTNGGHSSTPPNQTAVGIIASAISKLEQNPMQAYISKPIGLLFDNLAPDMSLVQGTVVSNRWLFGPLLSMQLSKKRSTNALIRTTFATTMIDGSRQINVLPKQASASVNVRILPGDSIADVIKHVNSVIDDNRIELILVGSSTEPSLISSSDSRGYQAIATSIKEVFPEILIAPSLLIASTDAKHYQSLVKNTYRFRPVWIKSEDISRFHGNDERISIKNLKQMTQFYYQVLKKAGAT